MSRSSWPRATLLRLHPVALSLPVVVVVIAGLVAWFLLPPPPSQFAGRRTALSHAELAPLEDRPEGFVSQAARLIGKSGLAVDLRLLRPKDSQERRPLVIVLGGLRTGRDAVDLLGNPGPLVVAALDYPYDGPERPRGVAESLAVLPSVRRAMLNTPPAVLLAVDWLIQQPEVDPDSIELVGVSFGVPFAAVAGALDARIRRVWLIQGGADNRLWIEHNLQPKIDGRLLRAGTAWLLNLLIHGPALDAGEWAPRIAPREIVIIGARQDRRLPVAQVERLSESSREPSELIWIDGGHVDRRPAAVRQLLEIVRTRIVCPSDEILEAGASTLLSEQSRKPGVLPSEPSRPGP